MPNEPYSPLLVAEEAERYGFTNIASLLRILHGQNLQLAMALDYAWSVMEATAFDEPLYAMEVETDPHHPWHEDYHLIKPAYDLAKEVLKT